MFSEECNKQHKTGEARINNRSDCFKNTFIKIGFLHDEDHPGSINKNDKRKQQQQHKEELDSQYRKPCLLFFNFSSHAQKIYDQIFNANNSMSSFFPFKSAFPMLSLCQS